MVDCTDLHIVKMYTEIPSQEEVWKWHGHIKHETFQYFVLHGQYLISHIGTCCQCTQVLHLP